VYVTFLGAHCQKFAILLKTDIDDQAGKTAALKNVDWVSAIFCVENFNLETFLASCGQKICVWTQLKSLNLRLMALNRGFSNIDRPNLSPKGGYKHLVIKISGRN